MRDGEIREQGSGRSRYSRRRATPTRAALLACRPQLARRPTAAARHRRFPEAGGRRLPKCPSARAGLRGDEEIVLEVRHLGKSFYSREGLFGEEGVQGGQGRLLQARAGQDAGRGRRIGLGQDHGRR